jgi:hypothetical protein
MLGVFYIANVAPADWQPNLDEFYARMTNIPNGTAPINFDIDHPHPELGYYP